MLVAADSATGSSDGRLAEARKANRPIRPAWDATRRHGRQESGRPWEASPVLGHRQGNLRRSRRDHPKAVRGVMA